MTKVKIRKVVEQTKETSYTDLPILLKFEHGSVNKNVDLGTRFTPGFFKDSKSKHKVVILQGGENQETTYMGSSESILNSGTSLRTFLALRHGKKLKIYETLPFYLSPALSTRSYLQPTDSGDQIKNIEGKRKAIKDLVSAFGSKKKRLSYERRDKNQIDSENMNESINEAAEVAQVSEKAPDAKDNSLATLIPPCNRETKDVKSVYSLEDILSTENLDKMNFVAQSLLDTSKDLINDWKSSKQFSDFFFEMLEKLTLSKSNEQTLLNTKLLIYTELLICILKLKHSDIRKKIVPIPSEFPTWLVNKALLEFTVVNSNKIRTQSVALKDKNCCYILILVLLMNDYAFDFKSISTSLQIHINKLLNLARAVGITVTLNPTTKEHRGVLKLPLPKPVETRGRARKMKK